MRAIDPRLLGWGRPTRIYLATAVLLGVLRALLLIAQAWLLASIVAGAFVGGQDLAALRVPMERLLVVIVLRALVAWGAEVSANRCSARVKSMMRTALVEHTARLGPGRHADGMGGGGRAGGTGVKGYWLPSPLAASTPWTDILPATSRRCCWPSNT